MSTTIGVGYSTIGDNEFYAELKSIADKFGYGLLNGIEYSELDVRSGLEVIKKNEGWESLLLLQSPITNGSSLAFDIDQELTHFEVTGARPKFFNFLSEISQIASRKCKKLGVFFAGEWHEDDRIRYSYEN